MGKKTVEIVLPEKLEFSIADRLSGGLSGYSLVKLRNEQYGIDLIQVREGFELPWTESYVADKMPARRFEDYESLRKAFK
jgi:hypothetical protein